MSEVIIDVRERDEYALEHVADSINVPLSVFTTVVPGVLNQLRDRKIVFLCRSGARAAQALEQAKGLGFNDAHSYGVYPGGLLEWKRLGLAVQKAGKSPLPLMRQMQITVGGMTLLFAVLGTFVNPWFSLATIVFGAGLLSAGVTGHCAAANLLAKAPWNKADPTLRKDYCRSAGNCP